MYPFIPSFSASVPRQRCRWVGYEWVLHDFIAETVSKPALCQKDIKPHTQFWLHNKGLRVVGASEVCGSQPDFEERRGGSTAGSRRRASQQTGVMDLMERMAGWGSGPCLHSLWQPSTSLSETTLGSPVWEMELDEITKNIYPFIISRCTFLETFI